MPEATHRIEITPDVHNARFPWDWNVYALEGNVWLSSGYAETEEEAVAGARLYIAKETAPAPKSLVIYTDSSGTLVPEPAE